MAASKKKRPSKTAIEVKRAESGDALKSDVVGYVGGLDIDLNRVMESGNTLETELSQHIKKELDQELINHEKLIKNLKKWQRQYKGRKRPKSTPWENSANISVPLTRSNIDTIHVRLMDAIFNRRKMVIVKARPNPNFKPENIPRANDVEGAIDWRQKHIWHLKDKLSPVILQQLKAGTGIMHVAWESKKRVVYRYADDMELENKDITKYALDGTSRKAVKDVQTIYEGPQNFPISREDVIVSSDATNFNDAYLCGFRKYYRLYEIKQKVRQGVFREGFIEKLGSPGTFDDVKENRASMQDKELTKTEFSGPYGLWTLWFRYDVDEDGDPDDCVVTIDPESGSIARAIYNPVFTGNRPFVKFVGYPTEFAFDGESSCEAAYQTQEEIDTIHNQRLDRMTGINCPITMSRSGDTVLDNFKFKPGKHYVADDISEDAFRWIVGPDVYPSTFAEEDRLTGLLDRVLGITPAVMGMSTSERPVFKETMANQEESNKKFKYFIDNLRDGITELIYQNLELEAQYSPTVSYQVEENGQMVEKSIELPIMAIRDGYDIELMASTEMMSQETRRAVNSEVYKLLSDYMTKMFGMAQMLDNEKVPPGIKKVLMGSADISTKIVKEILLDYDKPDAEQLVLDLSKYMSQEEILKPPPQMPPGGPPQGGPPGRGGPPQGGPPISRGTGQPLIEPQSQLEGLSMGAKTGDQGF